MGCIWHGGRGEAMRTAGRMTVAAVAMLLTACTYAGKSVDKEIAAVGNRAPRPDGFVICYGHGCTKRAATAFTAAEWDEIAAIFAGTPESPRAERRRIAYALARAEQIIGPKTGTGDDIGGSFPGLGRPGQMDCVDEMTNTGTYLTMFEQAGFLQYYRPGRRVSQAFFGRAVWPHTVTTMYDVADGTEYVIDTWLEDSGELPYIMPFKEWDAGKEIARAY